jgi:trk system potassium uptake protein TrkH
MFIGASPAGTGGGIKTTTFVVLVMNVVSTISGKERIEIRERSIPPLLVAKSISIALLAISLIVALTLVLLLSEDSDLLTTLFEVTSAFGTVGLTMGLTPKLSVLGRLIIAALMFTGRVGPLTLAVAIAQRQRQNHLGYPEESIVVG